MALDPSIPLELDVLLNGDHEEIGETRLWGHRIPFYFTEHEAFKDFDGFCIWYKGRLGIHIAPRIRRDRRRFANVLSHELTHAIEYLNDKDFLNPETKNGCTQLAQTMEGAWPSIVANLKLPSGLSLTGHISKKKRAR